MTTNVDYDIFIRKLQTFSLINMSKRIAFFIQPHPSAVTFEHYACSVIEYLYHSQPRSMIILCQSEQQSTMLDQQLWEYHPYQFIPHDLSDNDECRSPIRITTQQPNTIANKLIVNYNQNEFKCPANEIIEIISNAEPNKQSARERYRTYKANQATIETHTDVRQIIPT